MPEDELLEALRGLGADHEPDVVAIRRRMEDRRPKVVPLRRRVEEAPRKRPVLLSAAAALLVGGGVTAAVSQMAPASNQTPSTIPVNVPTFQSPSDPATSSAPSPTVTQESGKKQTPDGVSTSKDAGTPDSGGKTGQGTPSSSSPRSSTSSSTGGTSGNASGLTQATIEVTTMANGQQLMLSAADEDWLAIGTRNDLRTIRKKSAVSSPLLNFTAPASAASVDGPFKLSWTGGVPEQDRDGTTRWLQTDGAVVTVTASEAARTVTLYTGNLMNVAVTGQNLKQQRVELGSDAGYVVNITIPSHSGETTINLSSGRGPVHFLAATASSS
ncbi:hypothetical protein GCM10022223_21820 [Kineosporia mesophila]|uniref:DUF4115 domain-containing protein n=1 Tax=Kineosporia mesophila TaxID=566012 RepID=A0ABP6ZE15_9ACTN|nr:hypothetical protein [Kineosporia mesophila]MCD5350270.1 hypothetical protein [Kineosporia mesophila]